MDTLRPVQNVVKIQPERLGYRYLSGGDQTKNPDGVTATDIRMTPLTATANGRVADAKGKPVAGAIVWCIEGPNAQAVTDAQGRFALSNLPADGRATISAGKGKQIARLAVKMRGGKSDSGSLTALLLTLETTPAVSDAVLLARIAETFKQGTKAENDWAMRELMRSVARRDPDAALRLLGDATGKDADQNRFAALEAFAHTGDAARVADWGIAQIQNFSTDEWKCCAESELAITFATTRPDLANRFYNDALPLLVTATDPFNFARMIAASALLHRGDGEGMMTRLQAMNVEGWLGSEGTARLFAMIGRGDPAQAEKKIAEFDKETRPYAYARLIAAVLRSSARDAQTLLEKMRADVSPNDYSGGRELARATRRVIRALGPTDPDAALKLSRALAPFDSAKRLRSVVAALAASFQKGDAAKAAWKECTDMIPASDEGDIQAAEIACQCRALGGPLEITQELWERARKSLQGPTRSYGAEGSIANYAGFFDPPLARMLVERGVDYAANAPASARRAFAAAESATGLATSDPAYALSLIDQIPSEPDAPRDLKDSARVTARVTLAKILAFPPQKRLALLFSDQNDEFWDTD